MYRPADDPNLGEVAPLGEGGTASVARAYDKRFGRTVAVKYGREDLSDPLLFAQLSHREFELIGRHRFAGLVRLLDQEPNADRLTLEYCPGPTLDLVGRVDNPALALNLISAAAVSLEYLHLTGLIHGDLKPHNIFLPPDYAVNTGSQLFLTRVSDFSLGRKISQPEESRLGLGTVGYMAPETIADKRTSHKSDMFALGVIAYQILSGIHPFMEGDADPVKINSRVQESEPTPLRKLRPGLPEPVYDLVTSLLAKDDAERPESAWDVCLVLEAAGAAYPFRKVLRPGAMVQVDETYESNIDRLLELEPFEIDRLALLSDRNLNKLRLILTDNFNTGRLHYNGSKFEFEQDIHWPLCMRRDLIRKFTEGSWQKKKKTVLAAVLGGYDAATKVGLDVEPRFPSALLDILLPLLRPATVKRFAAVYSPLAYCNDAFGVATDLCLKAGNLDEAERCAELAAGELVKEHANSQAISVLRRIELASRTCGRQFDTRRTSLLRGNIHKDCGALDDAEQSYLKVITLYDRREPDKTLAETYKYLGDLHRLKQDSGAALEALEKSLGVFEKLGDELEISHTLTNIGNVHWLGNDTRQALKKYRAAYKIQKRLEVKADIASTLHNIATIFLLDGRLKRGIFLLDHALELKKEIGHAGEIARTLNNLGYGHQVAGDPSRAADYLAESLELNRRTGSTKEILYNIENLVALKISAGQLQDSLALLKEGTQTAQEHNLKSHMGVFHLHTATILKRLGRYGEAQAALGRVDDFLEKFDEYGLALATAIQKASLRKHVGDLTGAKEMAGAALDRAREGKLSQAELESLLLLVRLSDDEKKLQAALGIAREQHLVRETRLLKFGRAEFLMTQDRLPDARSELADSIPALFDLRQDMELPWMHNLAARLAMSQGDTDSATKHVARSKKMAESIGLTPELIEALLLQGKLDRDAGDYEAAYTACRRALNLARQILSLIPVEADRKLFQQTPVMTSLAGDIKSLGQYLGQKRGAGR